MAVEIEAKIKMGDADAVRARLKQLQGRFLKSGLEVNIFFDTPEKILLKGDRGLRIRSVRDLHSGEVSTVVTYKGPRAAGKLKTREERELKVESLEDGCRLFEGLGYVQTIRFEKKRESWELDDAKVELDTLPILGGFLEVEAKSQEAVMAVIHKLGEQGADFLTQSYAAMLDRAVKGEGNGQVKVVVF